MRSVEDGIPTQERGNEFPEGEPEPRPRAWSRFPKRFTPVNECSKNTSKTATSAILRNLRRGLQAAGSLGNALQHHEIGQDLCLAEPFKSEWV
jgi:hypothetical protein